MAVDGVTATAADVATIRDIIERRVNSTGVSEPLVQTQGSDRIVVELPGVSDPDAIRKLLGTTGRLDFIPLPRDTYGYVDTATGRRIASLARIAISDEEAQRLAPELGNILDWIEQLSEVDTADVAPMTAVIPNHLRLRDDVVTDGGIRDKVLSNAPQAEHGFFTVPKVIE